MGEYDLWGEFWQEHTGLKQLWVEGKGYEELPHLKYKYKI